MKKYLLGIALFLICINAYAVNELVSEDTLLLNLPKGSRFVVKQKMTLDQRTQYGGFVKVVYGRYSELFFDNYKTFEVGEILPIIETKAQENGYLRFNLSPEAQQGVLGLSPKDGAIPITVSEFNSRVGSYLEIIYDNPEPYKGMDKSMVEEIVMKKITIALKANDYAKALPEFEYLERNGSNLPESFYYYHTDTLEKSGKKEEARTHATDYLKKYGKKGKYYAQVIEIMARLN